MRISDVTRDVCIIFDETARWARAKILNEGRRTASALIRSLWPQMKAISHGRWSFTSAARMQIAMAAIREQKWTNR
jgi:hypothetical protein